MDRLSRLEELVGDAYQLAGQVVLGPPDHPPTEAQKTKLLDLLAYDIMDLIEELRNKDSGDA
jgi:hypothetical protein